MSSSSPIERRPRQRHRGAPSPSVCFDSDEIPSDSPRKAERVNEQHITPRKILEDFKDWLEASSSMKTCAALELAFARFTAEEGGGWWLSTYSHRPTCMPRGFQYEGALGQGSYGCVVAATRTSDGSAVALKLFTNTSHVPQSNSADDPDWSTLRELRVLRLLPPCALIVQPLEVVRCGPGDRTLCLVSEMMGESLESFIYYVYQQCYSPQSAATAASEEESNNLLSAFKHCSIRWIAQLLCALQFLHDCGVGHRDVKCANILLSLGAAEALENGHQCRQVPKVKLCDFGLARPYVRHRAPKRAVGDVTMREMDKRRETAPERLHRASDYGGYTQHVGTPVCLAPEVLCWSKHYSLAEADLWSLAADVIARLVGGPWPSGLFSEDYTGDPDCNGVENMQDQDAWILRRIACVIGRPSDRELKAVCRNVAYRRVLEAQYFAGLTVEDASRPDAGLRELYEASSPSGYDLLRSILQWDPADRASLEDAMNSEFFYSMGEHEWPACDWKVCRLQDSEDFDYEIGDSWDSRTLDSEMAWEVEAWQKRSTQHHRSYTRGRAARRSY
ncbi:Mitogen-activated protein kinase [Perkinsus chesapeaki]|uniref:Mitogen-activated protein kinase n=1 Tax=Perkinsus chesapeaki TaxID=330153 RepID=A0A7J6LHN7_PERCH|nr:Mitogen-activated protein kinase [Perkinsus chesapeaki]